MDPFNANRIVLQCTDSIILVSDFQPGGNSTPPIGQGKRFYLLGQYLSSSPSFGSGNDSRSPRYSSPSPSTGGNDSFQESGSGDRGKATRARIKNMVKELVTGENQATLMGGRGSNPNNGELQLHECGQVF